MSRLSNRKQNMGHVVMLSYASAMGKMRKIDPPMTLNEDEEAAARSRERQALRVAEGKRRADGRRHSL